MLKLNSLAAGFKRKLTTELWLYPDGSRILELSTKCPPKEMFQVAAEARAFLTGLGLDLSGQSADEDEDRAGAVLPKSRALVESFFTAAVALAQSSSASAPACPIRVALADDSFLMREAVHQVVEHQDDLEIVADCADGTALLAEVRRTKPDVVITDVRMPPSGDDEGIRVAQRLRETDPEIGVVVLSHYAEPRYGIELFARRRGGPRLPAEGPRGTTAASCRPRSRWSPAAAR